MEKDRLMYSKLSELKEASEECERLRNKSETLQGELLEGQKQSK